MAKDDNGFFICTAEEPWEEVKGKATHPDAFETVYNNFFCPNCEKTWEKS